MLNQAFTNLTTIYDYIKDLIQFPYTPYLQRVYSHMDMVMERLMEMMQPEEEAVMMVTVAAVVTRCPLWRVAAVVA
jgi:hypothetical protein